MKNPITGRAILALSLLLLFASISIAKADNVRVIPVGGIHTGDPIVTTSPAEIQIFSSSHTPITNVWLILIMNEDTYDHLTGITADATTFAKSDFAEAADKIPPKEPSGSYPGSKDQYALGAIKSKLGTSGKAYYAYKAFSISTITTAVQTFTLTVNAPGATQLRVLVLGNGYYAPLDNKGDGKLNQSTPWSGSTLVVPEVATLAIAASSFGALGLYAIKRGKKQ